MNEAQKRILFLCAQSTPRALMAASLLAAQGHEGWNIWSTPITTYIQDIDLMRRVLDEIAIPLLLAPQVAEPRFDLAWNEGVVLCSGNTDQ